MDYENYFGGRMELECPICLDKMATAVFANWSEHGARVLSQMQNITIDIPRKNKFPNEQRSRQFCKSSEYIILFPTFFRTSAATRTVRRASFRSGTIRIEAEKVICSHKIP